MRTGQDIGVGPALLPVLKRVAKNGWAGTRATAASAEAAEASETVERVEPIVPVAPSPDFLLWQLADSAFPTGGFAHSNGLEAAWQHAAVRNRDELGSFVEASLRQVGWNALPLVRAAHAEPGRLDEWDACCEAFTSNHVANRASRGQGRALWAAVEKVFPRAGAARPAPPFGHLAPVFGAAFHRLNVDLAQTLRVFVFQHLRGVMAAAVRLNIVGPMEAQAIQFRLGPMAESVCAGSANRTVEDLAQTSPLLEIWQASQDRLYARLFQS